MVPGSLTAVVRGSIETWAAEVVPSRGSCDPNNKGLGEVVVWITLPSLEVVGWPNDSGALSGLISGSAIAMGPEASETTPEEPNSSTGARTAVSVSELVPANRSKARRN